jgi:hypothetical protein
MSEQMCPEHGPFDGPACPYCGYPGQGPRTPQAPRPLGNDDQPTDLGFQPGAGRVSPGRIDEEAETQIPARRAQKNFLDADDDEETSIGRGRHEDVTELEEPTGGSQAVFWAIEGRRRGKIYPISKGTKIGREEGDLILDDPKVSSLHCKITVEDDDFLLWDFGSSNGTYVNGKKIREATVLKENDLVKIGESVFVVKLLEPKMRTRAATTRRAPAKKKSTTKKAAAG